ncbi:hypothetical protein EOS_32980 [Caballeronia mineralivorans PML1(12)]|uniref:Uncharacterized protein n=1 Tax=Caballeronia mineralivorans PML1(12) TaxID=908627 RepID=A0A0J1CN36_9BURK|nr:hypothetical protein EOS_32980 [Caballeronia mineralivorans PML1(12)]
MNSRVEGVGGTLSQDHAIFGRLPQYFYSTTTAASLFTRRATFRYRESLGAVEDRLLPDATDQWRSTPSVQRRTGSSHFESLDRSSTETFERHLRPQTDFTKPKRPFVVAPATWADDQPGFTSH